MAMQLRHLAGLSACAAAEYVHSPPPPYGLPPYMPGMAPPVPGPVFSPAFNALLVLLALGCVVAGVDMRDRIAKIRAGADGIGEENDIHTRGNPGHAAWLKGIQKTKGLHQGCGMASAVEPRGARPKPKKKGPAAPVPDSAVDSEDDERGGDVEMASIARGKKKPGKKKGKR